MALKFLSAICNNVSVLAITNRVKPLANARCYASKKKDEKEDKCKEPCCPNRTCEGYKLKRSIWDIFKNKKRPPPPRPVISKEKPPLETCKKYLEKKRWEPDPDLSEIGGTPYRTCGLAYLVQKDKLVTEDPGEEPEEKILEKIEKHPELKNVVDPMPPFESVERRLIELSERKLHPLYKRYMSMPCKKTTNLKLPKHVYNSRSGPICPDEIPPHLKIDKDCLERKNIFSDFKRVEPPRQLLAKLLEIKRNERRAVEAKSGEERCALHKPKKEINVSKVIKDKSDCKE